MPRLLLLNKPFGTLCQFSSEGDHPTLKDWVNVPDVYPAGRLDTDSEGLVLLTDHGVLQARISDPRHKLDKAYWVQVDGVPDEAALRSLSEGVELADGMTRPAVASASKSRRSFGHATLRSAFARRCRRAGSSWCCARGVIARCAA
jgi:23S rRNA pseudouridine2457 synthase